MVLMKRLLKKMYQNSAVFFPGMQITEIQKKSVQFVKKSMPKIPMDYTAFLELTDGLSWNGLELYGIHEHERNKGAFKHVGIFQAYETHQSNPLLTKKLVLGEAPEELIVFYQTQNEYQIIDRYTYQVIIKLPRFFDVLYFYAGFLIDAE